MFWTADVDPGVLTVVADRLGEAVFDIEKLAGSVVTDASGREHVAIRDRRGVVRLDIVAGTVRAGPVALSVHLDCTRLVAAKLLALDRLLRLFGIRDAGRRPSPADRRLARLVEGLCVVDALATGASLAEIASGLYGEEGASWPGDGDYLKSRVRRRVALARRLVREGPNGVLNYRL